MSTIQKDVKIKILKRIDRCPLKGGERYCLELKFQDTSSTINPNNEEYFKEVYISNTRKTVYFINLSLVHEDFKNNNYGVNLVLTGINS